MINHLNNYRHLVTLPDGSRALLRPLVAGDCENLVELFAHIPESDRQYFRNDVTNRELVTGWIDTLDYNKVFPLIAVIRDHIVGDATLHFRTGAHRHQGEVRIYLAQEVRRRGLGTQMLQTIVDIARKMDLHQLIVEIVAEQTPVVRAFEEAGFIRQAILPDHFMLPDGSTCDVALMILPLVQHQGEF